MNTLGSPFTVHITDPASGREEVNRWYERDDALTAFVTAISLSAAGTVVALARGGDTIARCRVEPKD